MESARHDGGHLVSVCIEETIYHQRRSFVGTPIDTVPTPSYATPCLCTFSFSFSMLLVSFPSPTLAMLNKGHLHICTIHPKTPTEESRKQHHKSNSSPTKQTHPAVVSPPPSSNG